MIEYITETGIFGIFWVIISIVFILSLINFIKIKGLKTTLTIILPIIIIFYLLNVISLESIGKTKYDNVLMLAKDSWFIIGPTIITSILISFDNNCVNFLNKKKIKELKKNDK